MRTKLIRVLLVLGIIFVVGVPVLRVIFGQTERQWERETLQRFGICPDFGLDIVCCARSYIRGVALSEPRQTRQMI